VQGNPPFEWAQFWLFIPFFRRVNLIFPPSRFGAGRMRPHVSIRVLALAVATTLFLSYLPKVVSAQNPNPYEGLRTQALQTTLTDLGIKLADDTLSAYGLVMDMGLPRGTATLVAFSSGDASLYVSTGGGIIGGIGHAAVRQSARGWIQSVQAHLSSFAPTTAFPQPAVGTVRLFVLTNRGVLTAVAAIEEINSGKLELSPVWYDGQRLLTDLRQSENKPTD